MQKSNITLIVLMILLCIVEIQSVRADLGSFYQGSCVNIRVINNCSNNNITEVTNNQLTYKLNAIMQNIGGQTWNYTFCNTSQIGTYTYSWFPNCYDCVNGNCGNSFTITLNGDNPTTGQAIIEMIIFIGILLSIILTIIGAIVMPFKDTHDDEDHIIEINDFKYFKIVLWFFVYLEIIFMTMILKNISGFMNSDGTYYFLNILYFILLILVLPIFFLIVIFSVIIYFSDKKRLKKIRMGVLE